jgi:hypothetical protein
VSARIAIGTILAPPVTAASPSFGRKLLWRVVARAHDGLVALREVENPGERAIWRRPEELAGCRVVREG